MRSASATIEIVTALDFRALDFRALDFRALNFRALEFRALDFRALGICFNFGDCRDPDSRIVPWQVRRSNQFIDALSGSLSVLSFATPGGVCHH